MNDNNDYFLTDDLKINHGSMFFRESGTFKTVTKRNWHHALASYGWGKLPKRWITKLNKLSSRSEKNSLYGVLDVASDGDCFFHCIAHALNEKNESTDVFYNSNDIRNIIAKSITKEQFEMMISYYRIMKDANDFDESWDPHEVESIDDFRAILNTTGHSYWGDYMLLQILIQVLHLNIFILNHNSDPEECSTYNTLNDYNEKYDSICLLFTDECHFKLMGYFNSSRMISYFTDKTLPKELLKLFSIIR